LQNRHACACAPRFVKNDPVEHHIGGAFSRMSVNEAAASMTSCEMKDHLDVVDRASRKASISQITF
jgi:hypothetical protein